MDALLDTLAGENLLSDRRFAAAYCRQRADKGYGPARIVLELRQRGIAEDIARQALADLALDWSQQARRAVRAKRFASPPARQDREWARQWRFLQQRGFASEHIRQALGGEDY